jgi:hypothetical protein
MLSPKLSRRGDSFFARNWRVVFSISQDQALPDSENPGKN